MYPKTYLETFMRYEESFDVFVAMPFTDEFRLAFDSVIEPAIRAATIGGRALTARIVNRGTTGAPDIHEQIYDAILHSRLVIADMTVQASYTGADGKRRWQPNANVAYEVGLASSWRNPEDILLIHQPHPEHAYSFDVQNLRHVPYDANNAATAASLTLEIERAIGQSKFLATQSFRRILQSTSPGAIQFMHEQSERPFPVVAIWSIKSPMDALTHAVTELLAVGALVNRRVIPAKEASGTNIIYQWTELGLKMMRVLGSVSAEQTNKLRQDIASVPPGMMPPLHLLELAGGVKVAPNPLNSTTDRLDEQ